MVQLNGFTVAIVTDGDQDKLKRADGDYVAIDNNTEYKLKLSNYRNTDAMAEVFIENDNVGTWFIRSNDSIVIERPADTNRKFTFMKETDSRAIRAGVIPGESTNGLVKVVFFPKKPTPIVMTSPKYESIRSARSLVSPQPSFRSQSMSPPRSAPISPPRSAPMSPSRSQQPVTSQSLAMSQPRYESRAVSSFRPVSQYESGATVLGDISNQEFSTMRRFNDNEIDWSNKTTITIRLVVRTNYRDNGYMYSVESYGSSGYDLRYPYISVGNRNKNNNGYPPRIDY